MLKGLWLVSSYRGAKLGPILFLIMVNDLQCTSGKSGISKFVDDVSFSEALSRNVESSVIQSDLTSVNAWASNNLMKLNVKKCKEMQICFFRDQPELPSLYVGNQVLESVSSHKILGLILQNYLKWNEHIAMSVSKASKRLHILRRLRDYSDYISYVYCAGEVPRHDLITIN